MRSPIEMTKYRTLVLATVGFNFSFLIWFSFAPFTGGMAEEFGLSTAEIGVLASSAIWMAPFGRILTGWLSDKFGAPVIFSIVLAYVGVFSIASAFIQQYSLFFVSRLIVDCRHHIRNRHPARRRVVRGGEPWPRRRRLRGDRKRRCCRRRAHSPARLWHRLERAAVRD